VHTGAAAVHLSSARSYSMDLRMKITKCCGMCCRGATIVFQPFDSLVYFGVGSGEYDELTRTHLNDTPEHTFRKIIWIHGSSLCAVLSAIQSLLLCLKAVLKTEKAPSEPLMLAKYDKLCLVVDEIIHEVIRRNPWNHLIPAICT
jgi:hypothetical protein